MDTTTVAHPAREATTTRFERGTCAECGTTTKTLTAPRPNVGHDYKGEMFCLSCNPRFVAGTLDMHFSDLERLEA